jgi:hypothetical protein
VSSKETLLVHFVGGLRRPTLVGSVTYSWPLIGLYVYPDHLEFGPGFKFMRRVSPPLKVFTVDEIENVGPTNHGVRFTFRNGEQWIFGRTDIGGVVRALEAQGVSITPEVVPSRWWPPL